LGIEEECFLCFLQQQHNLRKQLRSLEHF
jgi:hypothetical protein